MKANEADEVLEVFASTQARLHESRTERDAADSLADAEQLRLVTEHNNAAVLVSVAFRVAADNPDWTTFPAVAGRLFEALVRRPRIIDAYNAGADIGDIEERFDISRTALYALLADLGIKRGRPCRGRQPRVDRATVRLAAFLGTKPADIATANDCSLRTVQRILATRTVKYQPWVDAVATAPDGERLRGAWNRYVDELATYGPGITGVTEPAWPTDPNRRALAAVALAFRFTEHDSPLPDWLDPTKLAAPTTTSPVPKYIELAQPHTPPIVAQFNVALDAASFASI